MFQGFNKQRIRREDPAYQDRKRAWELVHSRQWLEFLKPLLEASAKDSEHKRLDSLDDAFKVAQHHAKIEQAKQLIAKVERMADEFPTLKVYGDAKPAS